MRILKTHVLSAILAVLAFAVAPSRGNGQTNIFPSSGSAGIGTTTPNEQLHIAHPTNARQFLGTTGSARVGLLLEGQPVGGIGRIQAYDYGAGRGIPLVLQTSGGNVGIGTGNPTYLLSVNGTIEAKEVIVETGWADYVFAPNYRLAPLSEVEQLIKTAKHLPGVPSAQEIARQGVNLGDMQARLLAKVEELTLYVIAQDKRIEKLEEENRQLRAAR